LQAGDARRVPWPLWNMQVEAVESRLCPAIAVPLAVLIGQMIGAPTRPTRCTHCPKQLIRNEKVGCSNHLSGTIVSKGSPLSNR
jgi:hypothetical protein